jgi:glycopeptide antibiotics resistance protein
MDSEIKRFIATVVVGASFILGFAFMQAYFEVKTFNKFSEQEATVVDAMFAELRVEACN